MTFACTLRSLEFLAEAADFNGLGQGGLSRVVLLWASRRLPLAHIRFAMHMRCRQAVDVPMLDSEIEAVVAPCRVEFFGLRQPRLPGLLDGSLEAFAVRFPELVPHPHPAEGL